MGKPTSTDCLTLNVTSGQWERGTFTNGLIGDGVRGVINMGEQGVYIVHRTTISFLPPGSDSWTPGPLMMSSAECGCYLTKDSFVTIHTNETDNVQEFSTYSWNWKSKDRWPSMSTQRRSPACGATTYHLLVAGGVSDWDEVLASVEIYHIETRTQLSRGGAMMREPRALFRLVPVGTTHPRLLAVGGHSGSSVLRSSEWWDEENNEWSEGPTLETGRKSFAALLAPAWVACTEIDPPPHSCPALDPGQNCLFTTAGLFWLINPPSMLQG